MVGLASLDQTAHTVYFVYVLSLARVFRFRSEDLWAGRSQNEVRDINPGEVDSIRSILLVRRLDAKAAKSC